MSNLPNTAATDQALIRASQSATKQANLQRSILSKQLSAIKLSSSTSYKTIGDLKMPGSENFVVPTAAELTPEEQQAWLTMDHSGLAQEAFQEMVTVAQSHGSESEEFKQAFEVYAARQAAVFSEYEFEIEQAKHDIKVSQQEIERLEETKGYWFGFKRLTGFNKATDYSIDVEEKLLQQKKLQLNNLTQSKESAAHSFELVATRIAEGKFDVAKREQENLMMNLTKEAGLSKEQLSAHISSLREVTDKFKEVQLSCDRWDYGLRAVRNITLLVAGGLAASAAFAFVGTLGAVATLGAGSLFAVKALAGVAASLLLCGGLGVASNGLEETIKLSEGTVSRAEAWGNFKSHSWQDIRTGLTAGIPAVAASQIGLMVLKSGRAVGALEGVSLGVRWGFDKTLQGAYKLLGRASNSVSNPVLKSGLTGMQNITAACHQISELGINAVVAAARGADFVISKVLGTTFRVVAAPFRFVGGAIYKIPGMPQFLHAAVDKLDYISGAFLNKTDGIGGVMLMPLRVVGSCTKAVFNFIPNMVERIMPKVVRATGDGFHSAASPELLRSQGRWFGATMGGTSSATNLALDRIDGTRSSISRHELLYNVGIDAATGGWAGRIGASSEMTIAASRNAVSVFWNRGVGFVKGALGIGALSVGAKSLTLNEDMDAEFISRTLAMSTTSYLLGGYASRDRSFANSIYSGSYRGVNPSTKYVPDKVKSYAKDKSKALMNPEDAPSTLRTTAENNALRQESLLTGKGRDSITENFLNHPEAQRVVDSLEQMNCRVIVDNNRATLTVPSSVMPGHRVRVDYQSDLLVPIKRYLKDKGVNTDTVEGFLAGINNDRKSFPRPFDIQTLPGRKPGTPLTDADLVEHFVRKVDLGKLRAESRRFSDLETLYDVSKHLADTPKAPPGIIKELGSDARNSNKIEMWTDKDGNKTVAISPEATYRDVCGAIAKVKYDHDVVGQAANYAKAKGEDFKGLSKFWEGLTQRDRDILSQTSPELSHAISLIDRGINPNPQPKKPDIKASDIYAESRVKAANSGNEPLAELYTKLQSTQKEVASSKTDLLESDLQKYLANEHLIKEARASVEDGASDLRLGELTARASAENNDLLINGTFRKHFSELSSAQRARENEIMFPGLRPLTAEETKQLQVYEKVLAAENEQVGLTADQRQKVDALEQKLLGENKGKPLNAKQQAKVDKLKSDLTYVRLSDNEQKLLDKDTLSFAKRDGLTRAEDRELAALSRVVDEDLPKNLRLRKKHLSERALTQEEKAPLVAREILKAEAADPVKFREDYPVFARYLEKYRSQGKSDAEIVGELGTRVLERKQFEQEHGDLARRKLYEELDGVKSNDLSKEEKAHYEILKKAPPGTLSKDEFRDLINYAKRIDEAAAAGELRKAIVQGELERAKSSATANMLDIDYDPRIYRSYSVLSPEERAEIDRIRMRPKHLTDEEKANDESHSHYRSLEDHPDYDGNDLLASNITKMLRGDRGDTLPWVKSQIERLRRFNDRNRGRPDRIFRAGARAGGAALIGYGGASAGMSLLGFDLLHGMKDLYAMQGDLSRISPAQVFPYLKEVRDIMSMFRADDERLSTLYGKYKWDEAQLWNGSHREKNKKGEEVDEFSSRIIVPPRGDLPWNRPGQAGISQGVKRGEFTGQTREALEAQGYLILNLDEFKDFYKEIATEERVDILVSAQDVHSGLEDLPYSNPLREQYLHDYDWTAASVFRKTEGDSETTEVVVPAKKGLHTAEPLRFAPEQLKELSSKVIGSEFETSFAKSRDDLISRFRELKEDNRFREKYFNGFAWNKAEIFSDGIGYKVRVPDRTSLTNPFALIRERGDLILSLPEVLSLQYDIQNELGETLQAAKR